MTSAPVRDPLSDHLLAPENAALLLIEPAHPARHRRHLAPRPTAPARTA
jgi:hypothetical protein